jgi:hypothetical protein
MQGSVLTLRNITGLLISKGRDSSAGIAACYGLDGLGIEYGWGDEIFRTSPDRPWGLPIYNGYRDFLGGKAAGGVVLTNHHLQCRGLNRV